MRRWLQRPGRGLAQRLAAPPGLPALPGRRAAEGRGAADVAAPAVPPPPHGVPPPPRAPPPPPLPPPPPALGVAVGGGGAVGSSARARPAVPAPGDERNAGEPGLRQPAASCGGFFEELTQQLEEKDVELVPTQEQHEQKSWLVSTLKPLLERHTGGRFHTFGSCENGFWMNGSDIDACLVLGRCTSRQSWLTKLRLVQSLVQRERIGTAQVVRAARVPVAKLKDQEGSELCDVSVNNVAALENSRFVAALAQLDPRVPRLGRFIKHWASRRQINNRSEGTLSTYTLILQLFFFLQTRQPPLLPRVVDLLADDLLDAASQRSLGASGGSGSPPGAETRAVNALVAQPEMDVVSGELRPLPFLADLAAIRREGRFPEGERSEESLGELLHGFFQLWGQEAFRGGDEGSGQTVLVYDGTREVNDLGVVVMRCPLTGKNVNPFTTVVWRAIHAEFERAAALLSRGSSLAELCEAAEESPAGRGPRRA